MTTHTSRALGTAYTREAGMCYVEQLRPGSAMMRLIPVEYHEHYSNNPLTVHRTRVDWRTINPSHKEAA